MTTPRGWRLSPRAAADLREIADFIAADNPERAVSFVRELLERCRDAARAPRSFPSRPELSPGLRAAAHGRYLILFRETGRDKHIVISRIVHGARNLPRLFR